MGLVSSIRIRRTLPFKARRALMIGLAIAAISSWSMGTTTDAAMAAPPMHSSTAVAAFPAADTHPDVWVYYSTYPTLAACLAAGEANFVLFECVQVGTSHSVAYNLFYWIDVCPVPGQAALPAKAAC